MTARRALVRVNGKTQQLAASDSLITGNLFRVENIQASAVGQTSFTVPNGYVAGSVLVWLNGALLSAGDYTATTSPTIVLAVGTTSATDIMAVACLTASTTVSPTMTGASATVAGASGLVPQPGVGQQLSLLRGDGTWVASLPAKNLLTNGLFNVNQRGYVSGTNTTAANQFTYDRWRVLTSGQNIAVSGVVATFPAGGGGQVVDGKDVLTGIHTLSWTGTGTATVNGAAVANGGQVSLTTGTNVAVVFIGQVSYPKLEFGTSKTPWDKRSFGEELFECTRYYQKSFPYATVPAQASGVYLGSLAYVSNTAGTVYYAVTVILPQRMRGTPTIVFYSPTSANATWRNRAAAADSGSASTSYGEVSETGFAAVNLQSSDTTIGQTICIHYVLEAELTA